MLEKVVKQVLPALRMLASREDVLNLRFDDREVFSAIQDAEALKQLPFISEDANILVVDETTDPTELVSDLEVKLSMWKEDRTDYPDYVLIRELGLVALAPHAAKLDQLFGYGEFDYPVPAVGCLEGLLSSPVQQWALVPVSHSYCFMKGRMLLSPTGMKTKGKKSRRY